MVDDRYRLAPIRDARERDERIQRGELAAATTGAREARARLDAARSRTQAARTAVAGAVAARDALLAAGSSPTRIVNAERFIGRRRHELDAALGEELRAESAHDAHQSSIELQRRRVARARADREVIERHFARWRQTQNKVADRRHE